MSDDIGYRPEPDGEPDPGEIVWAWVRPGAVDLSPAARHHTGALAALSHLDGPRPAFGTPPCHPTRLMTLATASIGGHGSEEDAGRGPGDRLRVLPPDGVRREGAALPEPLFREVLVAAREHHALG